VRVSYNLRSNTLLAMAYEYDVFVSYRRHAEWPKWVREIFLPLFSHWLGEELGRNAQIFVDHQIETGDSWPQRLGSALGQSKVLVPLFSRQYFASGWCQRELQHMLSRERAFGFRTTEHPNGLVNPAYIHDGNDFPSQVRHIQAASLQAYSNVRLAKNSPTEEQLSEAIRDWVPNIVHAIGSAPECDPRWAEQAAAALLEQLCLTDPVQTSPPRLI
jgi:hypothetical protein